MEEDLAVYPENIVALAKDTNHLGRMNNPTSAASIKGPCGDEMEFFLVIKDRIIEDGWMGTGHFAHPEVFQV